MIRHIYPDGSEGHEYQIGDKVIVHKTIHGGWFDIGPVGAEFCIVDRIEKRGTWRTNVLEVSYSPDWGRTSVMPWHASPHPETLATATVVMES